MNNYWLGENVVVRDGVANPEIGFLKRFCFTFTLFWYLTSCLSQGVLKLCPGKSLFTKSRIILGIPQMLIGLSLVVGFLKQGEYVFSSLRLMALLSTADCIFTLL